MSTSNIDTILERLVSDELFRAQFISNDVNIFNELVLTKEEIAALKKLDVKSYLHILDNQSALAKTDHKII